MSLNIIPPSQPLNVTNIITFIYGDPGIWKTSLAFTTKNPILFDFDQGAHRAFNRKDIVQISNWHEVARFNAQELQGYDTIIIDTAGRMLDVITKHLQQERKNTRMDGQLTQNGYGQLGLIFTNWVKMLRGLGKDIVLLAHAGEDKKGDDSVMRPDMIGGSRREAYKIADIMAYMTKEKSQNGMVTTLNFMPSSEFLAKDSGGIGNVVVQPMDTAPNQLANIIQATKDHINSFSAAAAAAQKDLSDLRSNLMSAECAKDFNVLLKTLKPNHPLYQQMKQDIWGTAKPISNITFDKQKGVFVDVSEDEPMANAAFSPASQQPPPQQTAAVQNQSASIH